MNVKKRRRAHRKQPLITMAGKTILTLLALSIIFCGCSKKDKEPDFEIIFANNITETEAKSYNVDVTIKSLNGLQKVLIEKVYLSAAENETIDEITVFDNPKEYRFQMAISVERYTIIRFTPTDTKGNSWVSSFTFKYGNL